MHSFHLKCAILSLLLIITEKFVVANVDDIKNEEPSDRDEVLAHFLRAPWINLNGSWKDEVKPICGNDVSTLFEKADAGEMWALRMMDASSKIPAGIFTGNIRDLGMYDECINARGHDNGSNIEGRHCTISVSMPTKFVKHASDIMNIQRLSLYNPSADIDLSLTLSVCLPSSCDVEDVTGFANASIQSTQRLTEFQVKVVQVKCSSAKSEEKAVTLGTILTMSFFAAVVLILLFCTFCDIFIRIKSDVKSPTLNNLAKFSFYTNAIKLSSTKVGPGTMTAIHGIRFLSMCLVVTVHRILTTLIKPGVNLSVYYELRDSWIAPLVLMLPYAVDTFFTLTGFLTGYFFLKVLRSGHKINFWHLYVHRYLRLAPCVAVLILFDIFILPYLGSGPLWETVLGVTNGFCEKNWWTNLLYVQNFVNPHEMCLLHTWYLAVEMQLYWISPIILYPLFHRPRIGLAILGVLFTGSFFTHAVQLVLKQYAFLFKMDRTFQQRHEEFFDSYTITYNRALPYFVGIFLGYYVINKKRDITTLQAAFGWILSFIFVAFCTWNTYYVQPNSTVYNAAWEATYVSVGRLGWSLAIAWILYACTQGHGGPVTRFLSLPMFIPLSRLAYCIYLVSAMIQVGINSTTRIAEFSSNFGVINLVWGDLALSIIAAFILNLCFETPVIVLEKMLIAKHSPSTIAKRASMRNNQKLLAVIRQNLDLSKFQGKSDSEIETRMSQPDFWQTASSVLNTLGRGSSKTPADWAKTWIDWKRDLLKNDIERDLRVGGSQDASSQSQTGITILEKELLIFFAALSCLSVDVTNTGKSETAHKQKASLGSCTMQNEGVGRISTLDSNPFGEKKSKFFGPTSADGDRYRERNIRNLP